MKSDQIAQGSCHSQVLNIFRDRDSTTCFSASFSVWENTLLTHHGDFHCCSLCPLPLILSLCIAKDSLSSFSPLTAYYTVPAAIRMSHFRHFSKLSKLTSPALFIDHAVTPYLSGLSQAPSAPASYLGAQNCAQYF